MKTSVEKEFVNSIFDPVLCYGVGDCLDPGTLLKLGTCNCMSYLLGEAEQYISFMLIIHNTYLLC